MYSRFVQILKFLQLIGYVGSFLLAIAYSNWVSMTFVSINNRFKSDFSKFYLEEVPSEVLSDDEWLLYSTILDSFDCIGATPDPLSKQLGCQSEREYIEWIQNQRQKYLRTKTPSNRITES
jgi:hypothetical protein